MKAGDLRHFVEIQHRATITPDAFGDVVGGWTVLDTDYAAIEPMSGREWFAAKQVGAQDSVRIRMRYRDDITRDMRIKHGSTVYEIESIVDVGGRGRELHIMAGVGSGHGD